MTFDELMRLTRPHIDTANRAGATILAYQQLFDAAGQSGDYEEMERCREVLKTQIDIQCDAKAAQYRLIEKWKKAGYQQ